MSLNVNNFDIEPIDIEKAKTNGWESEDLINRIHYYDGSSPSTHTFTFDIAEGSLPIGMELDSHTGRFFIPIGTLANSSGKRNITLQIQDESGVSSYLTVRFAGLYPPLNVEDIHQESLIATTRANFSIPLNVSGGVKFSEYFNFATANYIFTSNDLPKGLTISSNGVLEGRIINSQELSTSTIKVVDAIGNEAECLVNFGRIYQFPSFSLALETALSDYHEVGDNFEFELSDYLIGGDGHGSYFISTSLPQGLNYDSDTGRIYGSLSEEAARANQQILLVTYQDFHGGEANCQITFGPVLKKFTFEDISTEKVLSNIGIRDPLSYTLKDESIPLYVGYTIPKIKIMDYKESGTLIEFVQGGLPFERKENNETIYYYKFRAEGLAPDFSITETGELYGSAIMVTDAVREAQLYVIDARGKEIALREKTKIQQIKPKLALKKAINLSLPQIKEGIENKDSYKIDFIVEDYFPEEYDHLSFMPYDSGNWPEWLELRKSDSSFGTIITIAQNNLPRTVALKKNIYFIVSDSDQGSYRGTDQEMIVNIDCGQIIKTLKLKTEEVSFNSWSPPLQVGVISKSFLPPDAISGGIGPYTASAGSWDAQLKIHQLQDGEANANNIYIEILPKNPSFSIKSVLSIRDSTGGRGHDNNQSISLNVVAEKTI